MCDALTYQNRQCRNHNAVWSGEVVSVQGTHDARMVELCGTHYAGMIEHNAVTIAIPASYKPGMTGRTYRRTSRQGLVDLKNRIQTNMR
jgi:hypothetical protein